MAIVFGPTQWQYCAYQDILVQIAVQTASLGDPVAGGYLVCRNGGVAWIVAPNTTEVSRNWYSVNDAVTTAEANAACGDWFVPTCGQLQNPAFACRTHWDSYSNNAPYWSSTESTPTSAYVLLFGSGVVGDSNKLNTSCARAFRCVAY